MADEGIINTEAAVKASEQLGDLEFSLPFQELLEKSPLFKAGFEPNLAYYLREDILPKKKQRKKTYNVTGQYFEPDKTLEYFDKQKDDLQNSTAARLEYFELAQAIRDGEIPEGDFVSLGWHTMPGDKTVFKADRESDESDEKSLVMHEFIHRALATVPELKAWADENIRSVRSEEILMGALVVKYFPELAESEHKRIKEMYNVDLNTPINAALSEERIEKLESIAQDSLRKKDVKQALGLEFSQGGLVPGTNIDKPLQGGQRYV